ncbi:MAG: hypothetical protein ACREU2_09265 [Steroidobacteraceae bacterium]
MNTARGIVVWLALVIYRLGRCAVAFLGLAVLVGDAWAAALIVLAAATRCHWLLRAAACFAVLHLWHWPWPLAIVAAAPRLVLVLPGLVTTLLARWRHPRPLWMAPPASMPSAAAMER